MSVCVCVGHYLLTKIFNFLFFSIFLITLLLECLKADWKILLLPLFNKNKAEDLSRRMWCPKLGPPLCWYMRPWLCGNRDRVPGCWWFPAHFCALQPYWACSDLLSQLMCASHISILNTFFVVLMDFKKFQ